jgi:hypothetical protein
MELQTRTDIWAGSEEASIDSYSSFLTCFRAFHIEG